MEKQYRIRIDLSMNQIWPQGLGLTFFGMISRLLVIFCLPDEYVNDIVKI